MVDIEKSYDEIMNIWEKNLKSKGVQLPRKSTKNALVLIYLYNNMGKNVSKKELTLFLNKMGMKTNDVQQARHLAQQSGWYILSGTRGDIECKNYNVGYGEYMLKTIEEPYPSYNKLKRSEALNVESWEKLKEKYNYRCATCGSKEGEKNFLYPSSKTKLEKGHKNPRESLTLDNTIPQCQFCNRPSRDYFVFDNKGRVKSINNPEFVLKSSREIQKEMLKILIEKNYNYAKECIKIPASKKAI